MPTTNVSARDPKYRTECDGRPVDGVLYPRAGTLGGCTAHNAMILVCPHESDWDRIAQSTGDPSWSATNMQGYFRKLERCRHRPIQHVLDELGIDRTGHGWDGWLQTEKALPKDALRRPAPDRIRDPLGRDGAGGERPADSSVCAGSCVALAIPTIATSSTPTRTASATRR